jgi:hypothetical protein
LSNKRKKEHNSIKVPPIQEYQYQENNDPLIQYDQNPIQGKQDKRKQPPYEKENTRSESDQNSADVPVLNENMTINSIVTEEEPFLPNQFDESPQKDSSLESKCVDEASSSTVTSSNVNSHSLDLSTSFLSHDQSQQSLINKSEDSFSLIAGYYDDLFLQRIESMEQDGSS